MWGALGAEAGCVCLQLCGAQCGAQCGPGSCTVTGSGAERTVRGGGAPPREAPEVVSVGAGRLEALRASGELRAEAPGAEWDLVTRVWLGGPGRSQGGGSGRAQAST